MGRPGRSWGSSYYQNTLHEILKNLIKKINLGKGPVWKCSLVSTRWKHSVFIHCFFFLGFNFFHTLPLWLYAINFKIIIWSCFAAIIPEKRRWIMTLGKELGTSGSPQLFLKVVTWRIQKAITYFTKFFIHCKWHKSITLLFVLNLVHVTETNRFDLFIHLFINILVLLANPFVLFSGYWWITNISQSHLKLYECFIPKKNLLI